LRGLNLTLEAGELVALVGGNGSGKSTLLRLLSGLLTPESGHIVLDGCSSSSADFLPQCRRHLGLVFQNPESQLVANTVDEEVAFGPGQLGLPHAELCQRVEWALTQVGLWDRRSWQSHSLSAGQKQRLALAAVLAGRPRYLLLDEPTSMLDPEARKDLLQLLQQLRGQVGILLITHRSQELEGCDRVLHLSEGHIASELTGSQLWANSQLFSDLGLATPGSLRLQSLLQNNQPTHPFALEPQPTAHDFARCEQLRHTYCQGTPLSHRALTDITCHLPMGSGGSGSSSALIGQTGSGKSTLLQHLNLLLRPQKGRLQLFEEWVTPATSARAVRKRVGMLFQQPESQFFQETCWDEAAYAPANFGLDVPTLTRQALQQVALPVESFGPRSPFELSGGEQRRLALASVLSYAPQVLVLDEPTAGLDQHHRQQIWQLLRQLQQQGATLVIISHDLEEVGELATHTLWLHQGSLRAQGPPETLFPQLAAAGTEIPAWSQWACDHFPNHPVPVREAQFAQWAQP
jgi:energy-coupling factor transport system ATP-binding protein